jgi:hypothetical protein
VTIDEDVPRKGVPRKGATTFQKVQPLLGWKRCQPLFQKAPTTFGMEKVPTTFSKRKGGKGANHFFKTKRCQPLLGFANSARQKGGKMLGDTRNPDRSV